MEGPTGGKPWALSSFPEVIDFADDVVLMPHTWHESQDLPEKTRKLTDISQKLGLKIKKEIQGDVNRPEKPISLIYWYRSWQFI